ncbi:hypothetical protein MKX03_020098 [Papaver bracteatum]|nr:hypothetical protein MKX03_020098 [Papaver bracteatum]
MAANQRSSNSERRRLVVNISTSSSSSKPAPSQSPPPGLTMKFPLVHDHRSSSLSPELKVFYDQVFTALPQTPHFNPLANITSSENIKEGIKLGYDIAFLNLVMKFHNIVDPCSFLSEAEEESCTTEFKEFEDMGYDLTKIKQKFNLLKRKVEQEKLLNGLFVKISMDGHPFGRKVDIKAYDSYEKLSFAVGELFRIPLADGGGEYTLVYEDNERDRMLLGDVPYDMFASTVKRLHVKKSAEVSTTLRRELTSCHLANSRLVSLLLLSFDWISKATFRLFSV